jgi:hypothetical protein
MNRLRGDLWENTVLFYLSHYFQLF